MSNINKAGMPAKKPNGNVVSAVGANISCGIVITNKLKLKIANKINVTTSNLSFCSDLINL